MQRLLIVLVLTVGFALWSGGVAEASCNPGRQVYDYTGWAGAADTNIPNLHVVEGWLTAYNPYVQPDNGGSQNTSTLWIMMSNPSQTSWIQVGYRKNQGDANASPWIQWNNDSDPSTGVDFYYPENHAPGTQVLFRIVFDGTTRFNVYWGNPYNNTMYWKYGVDLNFWPINFEVAAEKTNNNDQEFGAFNDYIVYASSLRYRTQIPGYWQSFHVDFYSPGSQGMTAYFWGDGGSNGSSAAFYDASAACGYY